MGNGNTSTNKSTSSPVSGNLPAWAQTGTTDYNKMNSALQTAPMNAAVQTIGSGGLGQTSQNAMNQLSNMGGSNSWMNTAANGLQNVGQIGHGTQNQIAQNAQNVGQIDTSSLNGFMSQAGNAGQISGDNFQNVFNNAGQGGAADSYLTSTAKGDYLGGSPYLDEIISKGAGDIAGQTNNMFASGGRYGSGANQGVLSDSIAKYSNDLRNQNYQAERQNQLSAANALESAQQGRLGIQNSAASGLANVQGQNVSNSLAGTQLGANIAGQIGGMQNQNIQNNLAGQSLGLNAANSASNIQGQNISNQLGANQALGSLGQNKFNNQLNAQTGAAGIENQGMSNMLNMISQLPTIQGNKVFDAQQQQGVGSQIDQRTQQALQNAINQFQQGDMEAWSRLGGLITAGMGSAGSYGTQSGTQTGNNGGGLGIFGALLGLL